MEVKGFMDDLIKSITSTSIYNNQSFFSYHLPKPLWRNFAHKSIVVPEYLSEYVSFVKASIRKRGVPQSKIIAMLSNSDGSYFFVLRNLLMLHCTVQLSENEAYDIECGMLPMPAKALIDETIIAYALGAFIIDTNPYSEWDFSTLTKEESFYYETTDYYLTKIPCPVFHQYGLIFDNKLYLYNRFINRQPLNAGEYIPALFKVIQDNIDLSSTDFFYRLDERLAIKLTEQQIPLYDYAELYRGIAFSYSATTLRNSKSISLRYDPITNNRLLMVIKKSFDHDLEQEFWHVEIEELSYIDKTSSNYVQTRFIHGQYYPDKKAFRHIDYIINQYDLPEYQQKYLDRASGDIRVDYYTTKECHYKIWCIEGADISEDAWYKLTWISLLPKFRHLFQELID